MYLHWFFRPLAPSDHATISPHDVVAMSGTFNSSTGGLNIFPNQNVHLCMPFNPEVTPQPASRKSSLYKSPNTVELPDLNYLTEPTVRRASQGRGIRTRARRPSIAPNMKTSATAPSAALKRKKSASRLGSAAPSLSDVGRLPSLPSLPSLAPLPPLPLLPPSTCLPPEGFPSVASNIATPTVGLSRRSASSKSDYQMEPNSSLGRGKLPQQVASHSFIRRPRHLSSAPLIPEMGLPSFGRLHSPEDLATAETLHTQRIPKDTQQLNGAISPTTPQGRELMSHARRVSLCQKASSRDFCLTPLSPQATLARPMPHASEIGGYVW